MAAKAQKVWSSLPSSLVWFFGMKAPDCPACQVIAWITLELYCLSPVSVAREPKH